jgi:hypothetical protein
MTTDVATDYLTAVVSAITLHPRSLQKDIGPSEIGHVCERRIGYKLLGFPENDGRPNWKATVGTGVHLWAETAFSADNLRYTAPEQDLSLERWVIEKKVCVGKVNGVPITGHSDLYDTWTDTVIDHKTCGPQMLKNYRRKGAGQQYKIQAHLYGRGWARAGYPVKQVMVVFLPRQGDLDDSYIWGPHPYDEQIALDALARLEEIQSSVDQFGEYALELLPSHEHWCHQCPYFRFKSTDLRRGCPGDPQSPAAQTDRNQFEGLI